MEDIDYERIDKLISEGYLKVAQEELDKANEHPARWHYLQGRLFYKKSWYNESRKQLEIALELEPENSDYIKAMEKLNEKADAEEKKRSKSAEEKKNLGFDTFDGFKNRCAEACCFGCGECICSVACEAMCEGICGGCG